MVVLSVTWSLVFSTGACWSFCVTVDFRLGSVTMPHMTLCSGSG